MAGRDDAEFVDEFPSGHHIVRCFPVGGGAFAELWRFLQAVAG
ncbi:MAG TPA: hypothetical protein VFI46_02895 [Jiangellaceae bacterium]|nr:hypothetical protein [Jiangellaceae bacterium]